MQMMVQKKARKSRPFTDERGSAAATQIGTQTATRIATQIHAPQRTEPVAALQERANRSEPVQRIAQLQERLNFPTAPIQRQPVIQRQGWKKLLGFLSPSMSGKLLVNLAKKSPIRLNYEKKVRDFQDLALIYQVQSKQAMDIGADPYEETLPLVKVRQSFKDDARESTPNWIMDFIRERQAKKYGGGGMIQDPTAGSLLMKKLQAGLSPELAALSVMESSTRPAPDLFREILEWLETKNTSEHEPFFVEGLERGDFNEEDLESLVSKKE